MGEQFAVPYFFAINFVHQYLMGGAGGKFFKVACYVTYGRMACGTLSISRDGKAERRNLYWERYMSCTGGQMCYFNRVKMILSHKNSRIKENFNMNRRYVL